MGGHSYNTINASHRSVTFDYMDAPAARTFVQIDKRCINEKLAPNTGKIKECRNSSVHPNAYPIIIALDVTGSMRDIPKYFLAKLLTKLISEIQDKGFNDPAIMIIAIGDHENDRAPLQVSEFESGDEQLDMWMRLIWPEGGGGGNGGESYHLAWAYASNFTTSDLFEQKQQKGLLITIGDEPCLSELPSRDQQNLFGPGEWKDETSVSLLSKVQKKYDVFHLHIMQGQVGPSALGGWKELLGENTIPVHSYESTADEISKLVLQGVSKLGIAPASYSINTDPADEPAAADLTAEPFML